MTRGGCPYCAPDELCAIHLGIARGELTEAAGAVLLKRAFGGGEWLEDLHPRGQGGRFRDKPGVAKPSRPRVRAARDRAVKPDRPRATGRKPARGRTTTKPGQRDRPGLPSEEGALHTLPKFTEDELPDAVGEGAWTSRVADGLVKLQAGAAEDTERIYRSGKGSGYWTHERIELHNRIIKALLQGAEFHPEGGEAHFLAGGPASGKSTLIKGGKVHFPGDAVQINPDIVKTMLPEYELLKADGDPEASSKVHEESSYIATLAANIALGRGHHVVFDAVGDSEKGKFLRKINGARQKVGTGHAEVQPGTERWGKGHTVSLTYATMPTDMAQQLAKERAKRTKRNVPEGYLRAAHREVSTRFEDDILPDASIPFQIFDTQKKDKPRLIARRGPDGDVVIVDAKLYEQFLGKGRGEVQEAAFTEGEIELWLSEEQARPGTNWTQVSPAARKRIDPIVRHYRAKAHPFAACVRDQLKHGLSQDHANRRCAVVKDMALETTGWRKGGKVREFDELAGDAMRTLAEASAYLGTSGIRSAVIESMALRESAPDTPQHVLGEELLGDLAIVEWLRPEGFERWTVLLEDEGIWEAVFPTRRDKWVPGISEAGIGWGSLFDESKVRRDLKGRFAEKLGGLKPGGSISLPDGTKVTRRSATGNLPGTSIADTGKFAVEGAIPKTERNPKGRTLIHAANPDAAAHHALDLSAKSKDPKSLGGPRAHDSIEHAATVSQRAAASGGNRAANARAEAGIRAASSSGRSAGGPEGTLASQAAHVDDIGTGHPVMYMHPTKGQQVGQVVGTRADGSVRIAPKWDSPASAGRTVKRSDISHVHTGQGYRKLTGHKSRYKLRESEHALGVLAEADTPFERKLHVAQERQRKQTARRTKQAGSSTFDESKHPRGGKGTSAGGKFVKAGSSGGDVRAVQRKVGAEVDGKFGDQTKQMVMAFQQRYGLQVDGVVGRQTATALLGNAQKARSVKTGALSKGQRERLGTRAKRAKRKPARRGQGGVVV
ncbi:MAG: zeta toxin family protein [Chloroflexi bacterium]|nr:zeta toxin family protein [Chloroflexota bacterium]